MFIFMKIISNRIRCMPHVCYFHSVAFKSEYFSIWISNNLNYKSQIYIIFLCRTIRNVTVYIRLHMIVNILRIHFSSQIDALRGSLSVRIYYRIAWRTEYPRSLNARNFILVGTSVKRTRYYFLEGTGAS